MSFLKTRLCLIFLKNSAQSLCIIIQCSYVQRYQLNSSQGVETQWIA